VADALTNATAGWFPVFTALLGYVGSLLTESLRDKRATAREREARHSLTRAQLLERRANFQRETLLRLQDEALKLARAAGRMNHLDEMRFRETRKWGGTLFPDGLSDDAFQANVTIMVLTSRVRDDRIREIVSAFRTHANCVGTSPTREAATKALEKMSQLIEPLHTRIGEVLRQLDDDEDTGEGETASI
jgi:hypothetical protein